MSRWKLLEYWDASFFFKALHFYAFDSPHFPWTYLTLKPLLEIHMWATWRTDGLQYRSLTWKNIVNFVTCFFSLSWLQFVHFRSNPFPPYPVSFFFYSFFPFPFLLSDTSERLNICLNSPLPRKNNLSFVTSYAISSSKLVPFSCAPQVPSFIFINSFASHKDHELLS